MLHVLEEARDELLQPDVSALQSQLAAQKNAELVQQQAFEQQRLLHAQMQTKREPPAAPQLSEKDYEWLGARPGVEKDPTLGQTANALAFVYGARTPAYYQALDMKYPVSNYRPDQATAR